VPIFVSDFENEIELTIHRYRGIIIIE
jgi:hypothetical protein